jgi:hypothetical protein
MREPQYPAAKAPRCLVSAAPIKIPLARRMLCAEPRCAAFARGICFLAYSRTNSCLIGRDLVSAAAGTATSIVIVQTIFTFIICSAQHQERQLI